MEKRKIKARIQQFCNGLTPKQRLYISLGMLWVLVLMFIFGLLGRVAPLSDKQEEMEQLRETMQMIFPESDSEVINQTTDDHVSE